MADLLAAATLLLTVATVLYALWYQEIVTALDLPISDQKPDNRANHRKCRAVLWGKTVPLSVTTVILFLVNLPDTCKIVSNAVHHGFEIGTAAIQDYSAVKTSFVVVMLLLAFLAVHTIGKAIFLWRHVRELNPD